ncbi:MAG TPA: FKBP-type peptidyl-prolyl cis-trans isomerase [Dehalococcoidia bacterium]|nr:FKBP-type peptidyl-prolyl cis-trans isomerase [Dehalococcoidia bacterium]
MAAWSAGRRLPWLVASAAGLLLAAAAFAPGGTRGQASPSATATPRSTATTATTAPQPAPPIQNDDAVRAVLPADLQGSTRLPVRKWARADMPDAPGGYVVFIATIYPRFEDNSEWLLVNYLQWDGQQWQLALGGYAGVQLQGDDIWLAEHLTDITALASPPGQSYRVFTVAYTADGAFSDTLQRTETVVQIYDLTLTTAWSRVDALQDIDSSHAAYTLEHDESVDWIFKDLDGDGISELVATVTDTDTVTLAAGVAPDPSLPAAGTTTTTSTEVYKWSNGVFSLQSLGAPPAAAASTTPTPAPPAAATRSPAAATPPPATPSRSPAPAGSAATPAPTGTSFPASACPPASAYPPGVPALPAGAGPLVSSPSGLQYQEISMGSGATAQPGQLVTVNYTGYLDDGTVIDRSPGQSGQPVSFTLGLGQVVNGLDLGIAGMNVGGKRRIIVPYALGYGAVGQIPVIPPCARLTYDVELLSAQ